MKQVTLLLLARNHACHAQAYTFKTMFGQKADVTYANVLRATQAGLSFSFLFALLARTGRMGYEVRTAYNEKADVVRNEFSKEHADALYDRHRGILTGNQYTDRLLKAQRKMNARLARLRYNVLKKARD